MDFVWNNPGEPVPGETFTHSHLSWSSVTLMCFIHLIRSMASSLFNLHAWQSFSTISPSFLWPTTWPGNLHFILQSLSSFCSTCPYHRSLFCFAACFNQIQVFHNTYHFNMTFSDRRSSDVFDNWTVWQHPLWFLHTDYFTPGRGPKSWWVCLSVCITQRPRSWTSTTFCACCLWPWLSPSLIALWYAT